jgi:hypothetical protein
MEKGNQLSNNNIELLGCECLCSCDKVISDFICRNNFCDKNNCFKSVFGFDSKFYYKVEKYCNGEVLNYEVGLGYLIKDKKKTILVRFLPLYHGSKTETDCPSFDVCENFVCENNQSIIVTNFAPNHFNQILADENCLIVSIDKFLSAPLYVEKNTIVGRVNGAIEAIPVNLLFNQMLKFEDNNVKFYNGERWITLQEKIDEDTK